LHQPVQWRAAYLGLDAFFYQGDLFREAVDHGQATVDREGLLLIRGPCGDVRLAEAFDPIATETRTGVAEHDILPTEHMGSLLRNQMLPFP
jgi:hypothetical protein